MHKESMVVSATEKKPTTYQCTFVGESLFSGFTRNSCFCGKYMYLNFVVVGES